MGAQQGDGETIAEPPGERFWLDVPFAEKDKAKAAGACWDPSERLWYVSVPSERVRRWFPLSDPLPGENREFGSGLFVDLVPESCWFTNVRSCVASPTGRRRRRWALLERGGAAVSVLAKTMMTAMARTRSSSKMCR